MSQIIAIDYSKTQDANCATDDLQIIASALTTVETKILLIFSKIFLQKNKVENYGNWTAYRP